MTVLLLLAALIQDPTLQPETREAEEAAASTTAAQDSEISLLVGGSQLFTTPWPVTGVSITDPKVADVQLASPVHILVSGLSAGATDVHYWNERGESISRRVAVGIDLSLLRTSWVRVPHRAPARAAGSLLSVSGELQNAEQARQLHMWLDAAGLEYVDLTVVPGVQQVQVMVRVAEVSRTGVRALGVNGFGAGNDFFLGSTIGPSGAPESGRIGPPDGVFAMGASFTFNQEVGGVPR
jgi:pilus assembly protein CpaC